MLAGTVCGAVLMITSFRVLVVTTAILHVLGFFVLPQLPFLFSTDTIELLKYSGHGARINVSHPVIYIFYLLPYPCLVGLFALRNWARVLFLLYFLLLLVGSFFFGVSISGPPESTVNLAATLLDGGILSLAFLSTLRNDFLARKVT